jgi:hypothetical protein
MTPTAVGELIKTLLNQTHYSGLRWWPDKHGRLQTEYHNHIIIAIRGKPAPSTLESWFTYDAPTRPVDKTDWPERELSIGVRGGSIRSSVKFGKDDKDYVPASYLLAEASKPAYQDKLRALLDPFLNPLTVEDLKAVATEPGVLRQLVGDYSGQFVVGLEDAPARFVLRVADDDVSRFPKKVQVNGHTVAVEVEGGLEQIQPLSGAG